MSSGAGWDIVTQQHIAFHIGKAGEMLGSLPLFASFPQHSSKRGSRGLALRTFINSQFEHIRAYFYSLQLSSLMLKAAHMYPIGGFSKGTVVSFWPSPPSLSCMSILPSSCLPPQTAVNQPFLQGSSLLCSGIRYLETTVWDLVVPISIGHCF